jgi:ABC-type transport system involved in multi-copper enzyme maturation permease subunit
MIWIIARNTFLDFIKGRLLYITLAMGILLLLVTWVSTEFTFGIASRVCLDIGFGLVSISCVLLGLTLGVNIIPLEVENRTIFMILTRNVSRVQFYLGKALGVFLLLFINFAFLFSLMLIMSSYYGASLELWQYFASGYILIESTLVLLLCTFFSLIVSRPLNVILTLTMYLAGHTIPQLIETNFIKKIDSLYLFLKYSMMVIPNFNFINSRDNILFATEVPSMYFLQSISYFIFYATALIFFGIYRIRKMNFE